MSNARSIRNSTLWLAAFALVACDPSTAQEPVAAEVAGLVGEPSFAAAPAGARPELARARAASARYHDIEAALADGYADIDVVMPMMGHHYLRASNLDATFQAAAPELLVYAPHNGRMRLVAVEYAVPLALAESAPAGFSGDADRWDRNEQFQLWTLHAWVWLENPEGIFAPMNPRVEL